MSNIEFLQPVADEVRGMAQNGRTFLDIVNLIHARTGTESYAVGPVLAVFRLAFGLGLRDVEDVLGCELFGGSLMSLDEAERWFRTTLEQRGILRQSQN